MSIVVQKYGGSSVADVNRLRLVAERIMRTKGQGHDVVVVVSAMGDTTDDLLGLAKQISANPDRRELDMLLSAGERISMALLSMAIRELGGDAISFTGSQSGIITNDRHVDARIIEVRPFRVQDELARKKIVVVAGYQGVSYRREVTTLGRGGSDTTAVAMAAALEAEWCEICSDVDGVYTGDPRIVPSAKRIGVLSYEETQELAESGTKVSTDAYRTTYGGVSKHAVAEALRLVEAMNPFAVSYLSGMDPLASVTPEELITAILIEFEKSIVRSYYTNYVRNIFRVYLYRDDYSNLRPFQDRIREEAARALQEELNRLNRPQ